jgi:hypothetical protein
MLVRPRSLSARSRSGAQAKSSLTNGPTSS